MSAPLRIVLFGTNGQLGSHLLRTLSDAGYEVTGIDRARLDLMQATPKDIAVIIRAVEPQLVINAAAYTAVDDAEANEASAERINAVIPEMMAAACADQHVPLIHFSTDYVFDGLRGVPYREADEPHPLNAYGRSKRAGEIAVRAQGGYVFRLQWVYDGTHKNFFSTIATLLVVREELRVVADQLGSPSHARHIARAITQAIPGILSAAITPGIYHLTSQGHTSWHGFACAIAAATQSRARVVPIVTKEYPLPAMRPLDARLDTSTLASRGIAMPDWRDGLLLAIEEFHAGS